MSSRNALRAQFHRLHGEISVSVRSENTKSDKIEKNEIYNNYLLCKANMTIVM